MANEMVPGGADGSLVVAVDGSKAIAGLNSLEQRMYGFVYNVQNKFNTLGGTFNRFNTFIQNFNAGFGTLGNRILQFLAIRQVVQMLEGFLARMIEVNRVFTGFIASMSIIRGSVSNATEEYRFLLDISNKLGVSVESSISQYHRLAAALKNVDTTGELTRHIFSGISQAAVVLHSRGRDVTLIFEAVQQMASKGKLSLEELQRQLGNTLPGAMGIAARAMMQSEQFIKAGVKNAAEAEQFLRKGIEKGTINVYEFLLRLSNQLKKEYGAGVEYAADQFTANFNRMKNSIFEFYRMVGSSKAMEGLTAIIREITALFNDANGRGAEGLGQGLGKMFMDIAEWISKLDSSDVQEFFASVSAAMSATGIIVSEFLSVFQGIGGPEMQTPLLNFVEFTAKMMASLVDIFRVAVAGIEAAIRGMMDLFYSAREAVYGISDFVVGGGEMINNAFPSLLSETDKRGIAEYNAKRAAQQKTRDENAAAFSRAGNTFLYGPEENAYDRVSATFTDARNGLLANKYGITPGLNFNVPGATQIDSKTGMPAFMAYRSGKAGSSADEAAAYVNPLGDADMQRLMERVLANSNAPMSSDAKPKRPKADRVENNFLREQTRLIKDIAVAEVEYQNVLANKNRLEGVNEAQMRSLIATDDRYIKLSDSKKDRLMALAKSLDEVNLRVQNAIKSQSAWNDAMQAGFNIQDQVKDLNATGYTNRYSEESRTRNSFREGGENEFMDELNKQRMINAAIKMDDDQRILDLAKMTAEIRLANGEMKFQADLVEMGKWEQMKATEFRKIDLQVAQMSVGATQKQIEEYQRMAEVLKSEVGSAIDYVREKQNDLFAGMVRGMQSYIADSSDWAGQMEDITVRAFNGMEDAFVQFVETGKLSFSDLTRSIAKDLVRLITRYLMVWILQKLTGMAPSSSGAGSMAGFGNNVDGMFSVQGSNWGGFMGNGGGFAKGGAFQNGVQYFAKGGVFAQPFAFPMAGGKMGVGSESRPEAIMPLARDSSGVLGVKTVGAASGGETVMNLSIEVYQGEGKNVRTEQGKNEKGDVLRVFIGEVAADVQRGGPVAKALTQVYGLRRSPKSYS